MALVLVKKRNLRNFNHNYILRDCFNLWRLLLILVLYYQTKTSIGFLCRQRFNPKSLEGCSEILMYFLLFLYTLTSCILVLWPFIDIYIVLIFSHIFRRWCMFFHLSLQVLFLFSLYTHVSLCMQSLFLFHIWCLDKCCLSVSERQVVKIYHAMNSFLEKLFKSLY